MMCYERACRLCLKELQGPGIDCAAIVEMKDTIYTLFGFRISKNDITRSICNKCFGSVMSFKAFKKTVTECQSIIHEYETIKNKILKRDNSFKQEVIVLSDQEEAIEETSTSNMPRRRFPIPSQVTDSQINDILDLVHDNNDKGKNLKKANNKSKSIPPEITRVKGEETSSDPGENCADLVSSQDNGRDSSTQSFSNVASMGNGDNCTDSVPSRDSGRDNSIVESNDNGKERDRRRTSICAISTSGIPGTSEAGIKIEPETISSNVPAAVETTADVVTSSVPTPTKDNEEELSNSRPLKKPPPNTSTLGLKLLKCISSNANETSSNTSTTSTSIFSKSPENIAADSELGSAHFPCPHCSKKFESEEDLDRHSKEHEEVSENETTIVKPGRKRRSSEKGEVTPKRRSARIANSKAKIADSQALQKQLDPPKAHRRSMKKNSEQPQALVQLALSQPSPTTSTTLSTLSTPDNSEQRLQLNTGYKDSTKRVITITLLRSKETVTFKYCDQHKNIIDFQSVTPDELDDIRVSLMRPHIWSNLTKIFKASRPNEDIIQQLGTIFGQAFSM